MKRKLILLSLLVATAVSISACNNDVKETVGTASSVVSENVEKSTEVVATAEPTATPTVEPTAIPSAGTSNSNGGYIENDFEKADETLCEFETVEPTTLYASAEGSFFYDPNLIAANEPDYDGSLIVTGAYSAGDEFTFDQKVTYNGVEYVVYTRADGLVVLAEASNFTATKPSAEAPEVPPAPASQPEVTTAPSTSTSSADDIEAQKDALRKLGIPEDQINSMFDYSGYQTTEGIVVEDAPDFWDPGSFLSPELLEQLKGTETY